MKENIQTSLDYLADLCLEDNGNFREYTDENLLNATLIFNTILLDLTYQYQKPKLSEEQTLVIVEELGKNLRQHILLATGKDTHKLVRNLTKKA